MGNKLAAGMERVTGRRPRLLSDGADPASLGDGPVLMVGSMTVNRAARDLYYRAYDLTDYAWPGAGGSVVRTVRDPFGSGAHAVVVGGSDEAGAAGAVTRLLELVEEAGPEIGYVNQVTLGRHGDAVRAWSDELLGDDDEMWQRVGPWGSWAFMGHIGRAGAGYLRTGDEAYLPVFLREMRHFLEHDVFHPGESRSMIHSLVDAILVPWDLMADHAFFTAEIRREIDKGLLYLCRSDEGPGPLEGSPWVIRDNHGTGRALDAFFEGRYFWRRYGLEEGNRWVQLAADYFAPQLTSYKPLEDNYGHELGASLFNTLQYALAAGKTEYPGSEAMRRAAERAIIALPVGGTASGLLSACATATGDAGYLSLEAEAGAEAYVRGCAGMAGRFLLGEYLRAFCGVPAPAERRDLLGVAVAPLDALWHRTIDRRMNPGDLYVMTVPKETGFDKVSLREGFGREDFHLVLDGISGTSHSFDDANCIVRYLEEGVSWLSVGKQGADTSQTVRQQNGVFVAVDGEGAGNLHRFARLLYTQEESDCLAVGSALEGLGDADWQRHTVRKRGAWTLVVDRILVRNGGETIVERHWHVEGEVSATPEGAISRMGGDGVPLCLHLQSAGIPDEGMSGLADRKEVLRIRAEPDDRVEIATLLYVDSEPDAARYTCARTEAGWRVDADEGGTEVVVGDGGVTVGKTTGDAPEPTPGEFLPLVAEAPAASLGWRSLAVGGSVTSLAERDGWVAVGTEDGKVAVLGAGLEPRWHSCVGSPILSLHFFEDGLLVGEDNGTISRLDGNGKTIWRVHIPYVPISWPHWSDRRSRIREITSADIDDDGTQEILLSNGDRRVYAFDASGKQIWKTPIRWGNYVAMTPVDYRGAFALFGGATWPTLSGQCIIYGADGKERGRLKRFAIESQHVRDLRLSDLNGDGVDEIVCALDVNCRQLFVTDNQGEPIWDADVAGAAATVEIREYEGQRQVLCASDGGYLAAFDGATGDREWVCYLGDRARVLWSLSDGPVVAVCPSGRTFVVDEQGRLAGQTAFDSPVTGLLRPGEHRAQATAFPVGTADGQVHLLREE